MTSTTYDPTCARCGHLHSLHKHVERPDIWWCSGNGMGAGRCTCPVFTEALTTEDFEQYDDPVRTPFEMSFVFVRRGESIIWSAGKPCSITVGARGIELAPAQKSNGIISAEQSAEIRDFRLDCVIDDGAFSGRQAAWVAILAGLRLGEAPRVTFAQGTVCLGCRENSNDGGVRHTEDGIHHVDDDGDVDVDRMFHAYDTLYKGDEGLRVAPGDLYNLTMDFDPAALKKDEQIPIGFLRVVVSGMLIADAGEYE